MFTELSHRHTELSALSETQDEYYAAIDLGSNSFHMVIVRVLAGSLQIVSKNKHKVLLASGLDASNKLSDEAIKRGLICLKNFAEKLQDLPTKNVRIVATATLRLATNADTFIEAAQNILEQSIDIISGEEEASQIYLGVAYTSSNQGNSLVIDIGGASTEIILGRDLQAIHLASLNMGCVTFMDKYFSEGELNEDNFNQACEAAKQIIKPHINDFLCFDWQQCLGASGTPQAITQIMVRQGINDAIRLSYLYQLKTACLTHSHISQLDIDGLPATRQSVFPSGLAILIALFESLSIVDMHISGGALREGIIYGMLDNFQNTDRTDQGLNQLISRFHIDPTQSERAQKTCAYLYRQSESSKKNIESNYFPVLNAAAALHELGLHVGYQYYHEHGAYILNHVEIIGYTQLQRMMIRDLVANHRNDIVLDMLDTYGDELRQSMINALRVLRIAIILISRRKDDAIPQLKIVKQSDTQWDLILPVKMKQSHPLIHTALVHECWLQHKAGWKLTLIEPENPDISI